MKYIAYNRLREVLNYDPDTGLWTWVIPPKFTIIKSGTVAGKIRKDGYWRLAVDGTEFEAGRLIWFYITGYWPKDKVDHKDRDGLNNKWTNLREATHSQNLKNRAIQRNNTSGYKGVGWNKRTNKWMAHIGGHQYRKYLGSFQTAKEAAAAHNKAAREIYGEFADEP